MVLNTAIWGILGVSFRVMLNCMLNLRGVSFFSSCQAGFAMNFGGHGANLEYRKSTKFCGTCCHTAFCPTKNEALQVRVNLIRTPGSVGQFLSPISTCSSRNKISPTFFWSWNYESSRNHLAISHLSITFRTASLCLEDVYLLGPSLPLLTACPLSP